VKFASNTFLVKNNLINRIFYSLIILLAFICGCAGRQSYIQEEYPPTGLYLINNVPFYKQDSKTCGPAALASVLGYWGIDFDYSHIVHEIYSPTLGGSVDFEVSYYARKFNLWSKYYQSSLADLKEKIKKSIPLIVLQKETRRANDYHYIVVFGFDEEKGKLIAHVGKAANIQISYRQFLKKWEEADFGTIVICPPENVDWDLDSQGYIYLGYLLENKGSLEKAEEVYLKAIRLEPTAKVAYFNLGNVYFRKERFDQARESFKKTIQLDANFADAYNNLACVYLNTGKNLEEAEVLVKKALELNPKDSQYYLDTLTQIRNRLSKGVGND
jgi:tetratricopeptide (TPR) repeat protein